ncbi:hypothetical protein [Roseovarius sp. MBR-6]|uniref:hypothetical protein n=1 Tax=Roseovarius sp. MBR-6 TaxID=3156459 RepID=UPI003395CDCB
MTDKLKSGERLPAANEARRNRSHDRAGRECGSPSQNSEKAPQMHTTPLDKHLDPRRSQKCGGPANSPSA